MRGTEFAWFLNLASEIRVTRLKKKKPKNNSWSQDITGDYQIILHVRLDKKT